MRREWDLTNKILIQEQYYAVEFIKLSAKTIELEETTSGLILRISYFLIFGCCSFLSIQQIFIEHLLYARYYFK